MIDTIYFEEQVADHPRTLNLFKRFSQAVRIPCSHYKEVFNPSGQNFRLQKKKPALILAKNSGKLVHPVPATYGIGGDENYFSHMLNCLYDCRYCFLQGMYPSAHYLLFVNYENFFEEIKKVSSQNPEIPSWFFSGYDCDSLAFEKLTGFAQVCSFLFCQAQTGSSGIPDQKCSHPNFGKVRTIAQCGDCLQFHTSGNKRCNRKRCTHRFRPYSGNEKTVTKGWKLGIRLILSSTAMILKNATNL